jgi:hypothetical protein
MPRQRFDRRRDVLSFKAELSFNAGIPDGWRRSNYCGVALHGHCSAIWCFFDEKPTGATCERGCRTLPS